MRRFESTGFPMPPVNVTSSAAEVEQGLAELPWLDAHSHLCGAHLSARGLHDILLCPMGVGDLYAAGCPNGSRLPQSPRSASREEAQERIEEALPFLLRTSNTSTGWGVRIILKDLYDWTEPVTAANWKRLDDLIRERSSDPAWARSILARVNLRRSCTEYFRRGLGHGDEVLQYSLEWGLFQRTERGEYDTAVYDLERTWGRPPEAPAPTSGGLRPPTYRVIRTLEDVREAISHYVRSIPYSEVITTVTGFSTDIDYRLPSDSEMEDALKRRSIAGPAERDIYAAYICEAFLSALETRGNDIALQFKLGAEALPHETGSRIQQKTLAQLAEIIGRHPHLRFQCLLASRHANQTLCTFCRELPNLSLGGFWSHSSLPDSIRQIFSERLDSVPVNKQVGFVSDAYSVEWSYAKAVLVRKQMAEVFAGKIAQGQYDIDQALWVAREILFESPQSLLRMTPEPGHFRG